MFQEASEIPHFAEGNSAFMRRVGEQGRKMVNINKHHVIFLLHEHFYLIHVRQIFISDGAYVFCFASIARSLWAEVAYCVFNSEVSHSRNFLQFPKNIFCFSPLYPLKCFITTVNRTPPTANSLPLCLQRRGTRSFQRESILLNKMLK